MGRRSFLQGAAIFVSVVASAQAADINSGLQRCIPGQFAGTPIRDVVAYFRDLTDCSITLDPAVSSRTPITLQVQRMSIREMLSIISFAHGWQWRVEGNGVVIGPAVSVERTGKLADRSYDLKCLASDARHIATLKEVIARFVAADSRAKASLDAAGRLSLVGDPETIAAVTRMLSDLARMPRQGKGSWPCPRPGEECPPGFYAHVHQFPEGTRHRLRNEVTFEFRETPLADALASLGKQAGIQILLSPKGRRNATDKVTLAMTNVRLSAALHGVLDPLKLRFVATDSTVMVVTAAAFGGTQRAGGPESLCVYDCSPEPGKSLPTSVSGIVADLQRGVPADFVVACGRKVIAIVPLSDVPKLEHYHGWPHMRSAVIAGPTDKAPGRPTPRPAAGAIDAAGLKKGEATTVVLKDGTSVTGTLFSASSRHVSLMVEGKLRGFKADAVQRVTQGASDDAPSQEDP